MEQFPRDIQGIVYRYIFDSNHRAVLLQYNERWLNTIKWNNNYLAFVYTGTYIANYRRQTDGMKHICRFHDYGEEVVSRGCLPACYWHSVPDMKRFILSQHGIVYHIN